MLVGWSEFFAGCLLMGLTWLWDKKSDGSGWGCGGCVHTPSNGFPPWLFFRGSLLFSLHQSIQWTWAHRVKHRTAPFGALGDGHLSCPAFAAVLASTPFLAGHVGTLVIMCVLAGCVLTLNTRDYRSSFHFYLFTLYYTGLMFVSSVAVEAWSCVWVHSFFLLFFSRGWSLWTAETWWLAINSLWNNKVSSAKIQIFCL